MPKQNVPALRLEGFSGEWETGHFGDAGRELIGYPFESSEFSKDGVKLVRGMNIKRGSLDFNARIGMRWPSTEGVEDYLLEEDDIVIAMDGLVGTSFAKIETCHLPALLVQRVFRMRPESADPSFVYQSIVKGFALHAQLLRTSTTIAHLTSRDISAFPVSYPPTLEEQQANGAIFTNLDAVINQHTDKHRVLQRTKTALMQKMFPQDGQTEPEVRLDGFEGEWHEGLLGDAAVEFSYGLNAAAKAYDGITKYLRITDIHDSTREFRDDNLTSPNMPPELLADYWMQDGDIVFARTGASVGKTFIYTQKYGRVVFAGFLIRARIKDDFDPQFVFQQTLTDRYWRYIKIASQRSGQPGVNANEYRMCPVVFPPTLEEQQAIGAVFTQLDSLISAEAQFIEKLKQTKTALLQKMFV